MINRMINGGGETPDGMSIETIKDAMNLVARLLECGEIVPDQTTIETGEFRIVRVGGKFFETFDGGDSWHPLPTDIGRSMDIFF